MSKSYFIELADYNIWANCTVHSWLDKISEEQWNQPVVSSFNSIAETVLHVAGAETAWLERCSGVVSPTWLPAVFKGTKQETQEVWKKASQNLKTLLVNFEEKKLFDILKYKRFNGEEMEQPYYQLFAHAFNHSSYHRGQMVTMLRQVGFTGVGSTDMIVFFRTKK